ncbi:MAG: phosphatidate cytidylyltransferase [Deltaproteobacteria bacterium]|nr:phosphatidate cytidylyltransferase [Deltaproteobacteria bacterium]
MNPHGPSHHLQRLITGIVSAPLLIVFIWYSSELLFSLLILAVIEIAAWEYNCLAFGRKGFAWEKAEVLVFAGLIAISAYMADYIMITSVLTFCLLLSLLVFLFRITDQAIDMSKVGKVVLGFMYMPLLMSSFILLRHLPSGANWVLLALVLAFCGDIFGYYTGKTIGKRKLLVAVSPGKTVEGTIGLMCGSLLGGIIFQQLIFTELPLIHALILGAFGGMLGQLGDLFESALKRNAGVKDAGFIFPGHGGILDRLDSLSFIAPFVFYYQHFIII